MEFKNLETKFQKHIDLFKEEITNISAAKVSPAMLKNIAIIYDDKKIQLIECATIRVINAKTLGVKAWNNAHASCIEKAIKTASLGFSFLANAEEMHLIAPDLSADRRKELAKSINQFSLNVKNVLRNFRHDFLKDNKKATKEETMKIEKDLQKIMDKYNKMIDEITQKKQNELITV